MIAAAVENVDDVDGIIFDHIGDDGGVFERDCLQSWHDVIAQPAAARGVADTLAAALYAQDEFEGDARIFTGLPSVSSIQYQEG